MKEIVINLEIDGGQEIGNTIKNITQLKNEIKKLEETSQDLDLGSEAFEQAKTNIENLKKQLTDLSKTRAQVAKEAADATAKSEKEISDSLEKNAKAREEKMLKLGDNVQKFAQGLTDAFAGAFIALGASEKSTEEFNKTLQQGIGIAIGVKGAIEGVIAGAQLAGPAFKALNAVIAANPVLAIVAGIAALTAGIYLLVKAITAEEKESEKLTKQLEKQKEANDDIRDANENAVKVLEAKINLMKAEGKTNTDIKKVETELYNIKRETLLLNLEDLALTAKRNFAALQEKINNDSLTESYYKKAAAVADFFGQSEKAEAFRKAARREEAEDVKEDKDKLEQTLKDIDATKTELAVLDLNRKTRIAEEDKEDYEKWKKLQEEKAKKQREYLKSIEEAYKSLTQVVTDENANMNKSIAMAEAQSSEEIIFYVSKTQLAKMNAMAAEKAAVKKNTAEINQELRDKLAEQLKDVKLSQAQREALIRETNEKIEDNDKAQWSKMASNIDKYTQAIGSALNAIVGVFQAVAEYQNQEREQQLKEYQANADAQLAANDAAKEAELSKNGLTAKQKADIEKKYAEADYQIKLMAYNKETEVKKKAFEQDKKLKIAQTVIATITGAVSAITGGIQALGPIFGLILGGIVGTAVTVMGAVQVAKIKAQKFDGGTPPSPPSISAPAGSSTEGPDGVKDKALFSTGQNQTQTFAPGQQAERSADKEKTPVVKAIVVESDITDAQQKAAITKEKTTF